MPVNFYRPKILAIPTRFDTEYVWTATSDSLTVRVSLYRSRPDAHIALSYMTTIQKQSRALFIKIPFGFPLGPKLRPNYLRLRNLGLPRRLHIS